ncbi:MAG: PhzF family phenazine biosynthesis protein [Acidobacteria bacterium]|nr:PhzF family phenazine biosynthesis protein [Acidobacteriota bacterium]
MRYRYFTADVFTTVRFGGNQLAVFPEAQGLTATQMQQLAREFNYSETSFVFPTEDPAADFRLRIFTPNEELPFAGHPTIGAAFVLTQIGRLKLISGQAQITFEAVAGLIPVSVSADEDGFFEAVLTAPQSPQFSPDPIPTELAESLLGLTPASLASLVTPPKIVSCGLPFLLVSIPTRELMSEIRLSTAVWNTSFANQGPAAVCVFSPQADSPGADLHVRVFCPGLSIPEDPATGSAAAALGALLASLAPTPTGTLTWIIEQGIELNRQSRIRVAVDKRDGEISAVRVGGSAVAVMSGQIEL